MTVNTTYLGREIRPYQQAMREQIHEQLKENASTLAVMATGTGKTFTASTVVKDFQPRRTLWLVHTRELVFQAARALRQDTGMGVEIEMAEMAANSSLFNHCEIVVASRDTLISGREKKRFERFDPESFGLLVCDEAHHATADSYDSIFAHFRRNKDLKILGLTATPNRADETALGKIFESVAGVYDIEDAIKEGYLVNINAVQVFVDGLDYSHIHTTAGDLNQGELGEVMEAEEPVQRVAQTTYEAMYGLPPASLEGEPTMWRNQTYERQHLTTLCFCVRVQHAELLAAILNRIEPGCAESIDGKTSHADRNRILTDYRSGKLKCLTNCGVMGEGVDVPNIHNLVMARPTKSKPLYIQQMGRVTRTWPGCIDGLKTATERLGAIQASPKPFATVYDFVGNTGRHKLVRVIDALGGNYNEAEIERAEKLAQHEDGTRTPLELLQEARERIEAERKSRLARQQAQRQRIVAKTNVTLRAADVFSALDIAPSRVFGWDTDKRLSPKQSALLAKQGINPDELNYTEGNQIIKEMFRRWNSELCSLKQAKVLKRYDIDTRNLPKKNASVILDALANNHWQRNEFVAGVIEKMTVKA